MKDLDESDISDILHQAFAEQSAEDFLAMEQALLNLESNPNDGESLRTVFRVCHTLKGDAQALGFERLAEIAHRLEDLLAGLRSGALQLSEGLVNLLLDALDVGRSMAADALAGTQRSGDAGSQLLTRIDQVLESGMDSNRPPLDPDPDGASHEPRVTSEAEPTLRVKVALLDRLLNLAGEIAIGRGGLATRLASDERITAAEALAIHEELDPLVDELQEAVMEVRLVPIAPLFQQQKRLVRDTAVSEGKDISLRIDGDGAELDTTIVEHLRDPLAHMIRNAVAHGIEDPAERKRVGKSPKAEVSLTAMREGSNVVVEVRDDGRGLDPDAIREKAVRNGLLEEQDVVSEQELHELIFESGFSTAESTNRIAGRGVGMDVVRRNVEDVGGTVGVSSSSGQGTCFRIELPLTVAIIEALGVETAGEQYVIPLSVVVECLEISKDEVGTSVGGVIDLRGRALPIVRLSQVLGLPDASPPRQHVVVIQHRGERAGIAVDVLHGESQAVVKPLDPVFREISGIAGTTIRSDGRVALILDAPTLLRTAVGWRPNGQERERAYTSVGA